MKNYLSNLLPMHFHEKLDQIFKSNVWKHRTLRTVFDPYSSEYTETSIEKKIAILKTISDNGIDLGQVIKEYKKFYREENKPHVISSIEDGLINLLEGSLTNT